MISAVHIAAGAAIAEKTHNPILGILFAFLSHYALDLIPHYEYSLGGDRKKTWKNRSAILKMSADFSLGILAVLLLAKNLPLALAGGIVAVLPDAMVFLTDFLPKNKFSEKYREFHLIWLHFLSRKKISLFWRISSQVAVFSIALYFLQR